MLRCSLTSLKILNLSNKFIYIGYNLIGNNGVKYLVKMDLPNLETLIIGNYALIQVIVKLEARG